MNAKMTDKNFNETYIYCHHVEDFLTRPTAGEKARRNELKARFYADGRLPRTERYELLRLNEKINWAFYCAQGRCHEH